MLYMTCNSTSTATTIQDNAGDKTPHPIFPLYFPIRIQFNVPM